MKYYIATKLENHEEHNRVRDMLSELGHEITYDWTFHGSVWRDGLERCRKVAILETQGVVSADVVIVLWPGGRGTHAELGIAIGANIPVVFVSSNPDHHCATPETCAFYHHPLVVRLRATSAIPAIMYRIQEWAV